MRVRSPHLAVVALVLLAADCPGIAAAATIRSCGADALLNTETVLCAPPSGPCDGATVRVSASIAIPRGACVFDLGGRALEVARTLEVQGSENGVQGGIQILNAAAVAIARSGRLKARGDLVRTDGAIAGGGRITVVSSGAIVVGGTIDVSGDSAGSIRLDAQGDVVLERSAQIRANGVGNFFDTGKSYASGGILEVGARSGNVRCLGSVRMRGANAGVGGDVDLEAARSIEVRGKTDLSGGSAGGGTFTAYGGDEVRIVRARIDVRSRGGGDMGGAVDVTAGEPFGSVLVDQGGGVYPGGDLIIEASRFDLRGSANDEGFSGAGGDFDVVAFGRLTLDARSSIRADGAGSPDNPDGLGGFITFNADRAYEDEASTRSDLVVAGAISARGASREGEGGWVELYADRDLTLSAAVDVGGRFGSGNIHAVAGRDLLVDGPLTAAVDGATGGGGIVKLLAGASEVGALTIAESLRAAGGLRSAYAPSVELTGCPVRIADGVTVDAAAGGSPGTPALPTLAFFSGRPLELGAHSRYVAGPGGVVTVTHPPTLVPAIGPGAVFDPSPLVEVVVDASLFPRCPRCGDGPGDACAPVVSIDALTARPDAIDVGARVESPLGLPLSGTVEVCDGSGIEELTFTWLAYGCQGLDTLELLVNGVVVADVSDAVGDCAGGGGAAQLHTVPIDVASGLLVPGANRLGIRKSTGQPTAFNTALAWAYATVTAGGSVRRVPLFDAPLYPLEPFGTTSYDDIGYSAGSTFAAVDATGEVQLCNAVAAVPWSGALPCGLDLTPLAPSQDYTLLLRATDGAVAQPSTATRDFTYGGEGTLSLNGGTCGGGS